MKTTLLLSTIAVLSTGSTISFANNYVAYSTAQGDANIAVTTIVPAIGATNWGYHAPRQHRLRITAR